MASEENKCKILKIVENKFHYTSEDFLPISNTNFPPKHFGFSSGKPRYWKIKVNKFNNQNSTIEAEILDYDSEEIDRFKLQKKKTDINKFEFSKMDWSKLKPCLTHYTENSHKQIPSAFSNILPKKEQIEPVIKPNKENNLALEEHKLINVRLKLNNIKSNETEIRTPEKREIQLKFSEYYKNASFQDGCIIVEKYAQEISSIVKIEIANKHIIANYDYIKHYFSTITGSKKFNVLAKLTFLDGELNNITATSTEIEAINESTIEKVKDARAIEIINIKSAGKEDSCIYSADEVLSKLDESQNVFNQTEKEIIERIINSKSVRNKKQLLYLSGKQAKGSNIKFTLNPVFGYLFLINEGNHKIACWELLRSNATYIWSFSEEESLDNIYGRIQKTIKTIELNGRKKYRAANKRKEIDEDLNFKLINHTRFNKIESDGFVLWKKKLEEYLLRIHITK